MQNEMLIFTTETTRCASVATETAWSRRSERHLLLWVGIRLCRGNRCAMLFSSLHDTKLRSKWCEGNANGIRGAKLAEHDKKRIPLMANKRIRIVHVHAHTWDRVLYMHIPRLGSSFAYIYLICLREMVIWWDSSAMRSSVVSFAREKGLQFSHENFCHRRCWCWCFCCRLLMVLSVCLMCVYAEHIATNLNIIYGLNGESFRLHMGDWALSRRHNDEQRIGNDCLHILHSSAFFQPFFLFFYTFILKLHVASSCASSIGEFAYNGCCDDIFNRYFFSHFRFNGKLLSERLNESFAETLNHAKLTIWHLTVFLRSVHDSVRMMLKAWR